MERKLGMLARVSTYQASPNQTHKAIRYVREQIKARLKYQGRFKGVYYLVNHESGKAFLVSLWGSKEALEASGEEAAYRLLDIEKAAGAHLVGVERYKVDCLDEGEQEKKACISSTAKEAIGGENLDATEEVYIPDYVMIDFGMKGKAPAEDMSSGVANGKGEGA